MQQRYHMYLKSIYIDLFFLPGITTSPEIYLLKFKKHYAGYCKARIPSYNHTKSLLFWMICLIQIDLKKGGIKPTIIKIKKGVIK